MNTFLRFFYEFISIFFDGLLFIIKAIGEGLAQMFSIKSYLKIVNSYKGSFQEGEWILLWILVAVLVIIVGLVIFLIVTRLMRFFKLGKKRMNQEDLLNEISDLNDQVAKLMKEKDEIMAMKVSQLGLKPDDKEKEESDNLSEEEDLDADELAGINSRFPMLCSIDRRFKGFKPKNYNNNLTLEELVDNFRCFSATQLHLYYEPGLLRAFIAGLASGKLIILQGISGTGKTSLAYAWGKFINKDSCVASVEPSWRDKTELIGYFNEFTKKFNETKVLVELYVASLDDDIHTIILDEMNIARVEYYFAEMLSILEMPSREEWIIPVVSSGWADDPERIVDGKLKLPGNLWYIGTINNDDSTFMVTDKVYDRAMPIDINTRCDPFKSREQEAMSINSSYLESLFKKAQEDKPVSAKSIEKIQDMELYVINHFRVAFGNRIMKQLNAFVPVYVSCGGKEVDGIDYFISKKIFRKFDQLNISLIRDEIDPFIKYLHKTFGDESMSECIQYLERLKKSF